MTELEDDGDLDDVGDAESSLGLFDRRTDQSEASLAIQGEFMHGPNAEQDDCDRDEDGPAEESEPSGIGDIDGVLEPFGSQDWQDGGVV